MNGQRQRLLRFVSLLLLLPGLPPGGTIPLTEMTTGKGLAQENPKERFWCRDLPEQRAVYCGFRAYENLGHDRNAMLDLIEKEGLDKDWPPLT